MYHIHELENMKEFYLEDVNNPKTNIIIKKYPEIHKKLSESVMNFCYYYSLNRTGEPRGFINQLHCKDYKEEKSDKKNKHHTKGELHRKMTTCYDLLLWDNISGIQNFKTEASEKNYCSTLKKCVEILDKVF